MTQLQPAVVVLGHERPECLARLLDSAARADYRRFSGVTLVLSLDKSDHGETLETARRFSWPHGPKRLIERPSHLGWFEHVLACADLSAEYGAIVLLEDDLYVAPDYYNYAVQALEFYAGDPSLAGISLYGIRVNEYTPIHLPFQPLDDGTSVFFLQKGVPWGWALSGCQWGRFRAWFAGGRRAPNCSRDLPPRVNSWPSSSFSKVFIAYLVDTGRFVVYPRRSLCTNFGPAGAQRTADGTHFQVPLDLSIRPRRFSRIGESLALYDSHCELLPERLDRLTDGFLGLRYAVDLYGTRALDKSDADLVLTTRRATRHRRSFGRNLMPMELNVIARIPGEEIVFCETSAVKATPGDEEEGTLRALAYFYGDIPFGKHAIADLGALRLACLEKELAIADLRERIGRASQAPNPAPTPPGLAASLVRRLRRVSGRPGAPGDGRG